MFSKRTVIVSTSAGASPKSAMKDVEDALFYLGVPSIVKYGIVVQAMNWDGVKESKKVKIERDTSKIAAKLSKKGKLHVGIKTRFTFNMMRMMQKKRLGLFACGKRILGGQWMAWKKSAMEIMR